MKGKNSSEWIFIAIIVILSIIIAIISHNIADKNNQRGINININEFVNDMSKNSTIETNDENVVENPTPDSSITLDISELQNINFVDNNKLEEFFNTYAGKKVKVTGYVNGYGEGIENGPKGDVTYVNLGDEETFKEKIYVSGYTILPENIQTINNLNIGQKITIIGIVEKETWPLNLSNVEILQ